MRQRAPDGTSFSTYGDARAPCVVMIHGLGLTQEMWQPHISFLAHDYRPVLYDLYGHGESAAPPEPPSLSLFANQLTGLLAHLAVPQAALVGFSLGGMINRRVAIDAPEKVSALVILNSPHERGEAAQREVELRAKASAAGGPGATLGATLERWFTPQFRENNPGLVSKVAETVRANDPATYAACRWVLANGVLELIRPIPPLTVRSLVMTCENDTGSTPAMARAIAAEIDGSALHIVPGLQHMGLVEAPGSFAEPIHAFLARKNG